MTDLKARVADTIGQRITLFACAPTIRYGSEPMVLEGEFTEQDSTGKWTFETGRATYYFFEDEIVLMEVL